MNNNIDNNIDNNINIDTINTIDNNKNIPEKFAKFIRFAFFLSQQFNSHILLEQFIVGPGDKHIQLVQAFFDDAKNIKKNLRKLLNIHKHKPEKLLQPDKPKRKYNKKIVHNTGDSFIDNIINAAANTDIDIGDNDKKQHAINDVNNIIKQTDIVTQTETEVVTEIVTETEGDNKDNTEPKANTTETKAKKQTKTTKQPKTTKEHKTPEHKTKKQNKTPNAPKKKNINCEIIQDPQQELLQEQEETEEELEVQPFQHDGAHFLIDQNGFLYHIDSHILLGQFIHGQVTLY